MEYRDSDKTTSQELKLNKTITQDFYNMDNYDRSKFLVIAAPTTKLLRELTDILFRVLHNYLLNHVGNTWFFTLNLA